MSRKIDVSFNSAGGLSAEYRPRTDLSLSPSLLGPFFFALGRSFCLHPLAYGLICRLPKGTLPLGLFSHSLQRGTTWQGQHTIGKSLA
jgi:hypothetical protein